MAENRSRKSEYAKSTWFCENLLFFLWLSYDNHMFYIYLYILCQIILFWNDVRLLKPFLKPYLATNFIKWFEPVLHWD